MKTLKAKYGKLSDAMDDINIDASSGQLSMIELFRKYSPIIAAPTKYSVFRTSVYRTGVMRRSKDVRKKVQSVIREKKKLAVSEVRKSLASTRTQSPLAEAIRNQVVDLIAAEKAKRIPIHHQRMLRAVEKIGVVVDDIAPGRDTLSSDINDVQKFDDLARRVLGIPDEKPVTSHQFNLMMVVQDGYIPPAIDVTEASDSDEG